MTQSPVALAQMALKVAQDGIETYSSHFSRKDFTQPQLFAILALKQFFSTDYRGVIQYLHDFSDLRQALKLKRQMKTQFDKELYKQRSQIESIFSRHKRLMGSALRGRTETSQKRECLYRVLTHNLMILRCA